MMPQERRPNTPQAEAGGILTIDLDATAANWRELKRRAAPATCSAVVKADGYGCGIREVSAALAKAGCTTFFAAHLGEARGVRAAAPDAFVYVLNGLAPGTSPAYAEANLRPVIGSLAEHAEWHAFTASSGWRGGAALHVDTGINRLGMGFEEAAVFAGRPQAEQADFSLLMSHFACSEVPEHPLNAKQIAAFQQVRAAFPDLPASLANSSGIFLGPDAHHDLVRPGVALYGVNPTPTHVNPMRPVVELHARIVQVRNVAAGDTVGYGATWTATRATRLAILSIGYADGFMRAASARGEKPGADAIVAGHRCPLAGMISMDLMAIDVTDVPDAGPQRGDFATLIGDTISVDDVASHAGTIGYEVLTSLGPRYARVYKGG